MPNNNISLIYCFFWRGGGHQICKMIIRRTRVSQKRLLVKNLFVHRALHQNINADKEGKGTLATGMRVALCRLSKKAIQGLGRASRGVD